MDLHYKYVLCKLKLYKISIKDSHTGCDLKVTKLLKSMVIGEDAEFDVWGGGIKSTFIEIIALFLSLKHITQPTRQSVQTRKQT